MMGVSRLICVFGILILVSNNSQSQNIKNVNYVDEESKQFIKNRGYSIEACYRLAEDYIKSSTNQRKAIPYLEHIIENDNSVKPLVYYMLSQAYYYNGTFDLAAKMLSSYIEKEKDSKLKKEAILELEKYENAKRIASSPLNVILMNLGPQVNSQFADINPCVTALENLLVYSSKRGSDFNIYVSKKDFKATIWEKSKLAGKFVNTFNDEFVAGLSRDGDELFVHYNQVSGFEDINLSKRNKGLFRELEDPSSKINSTYREEGACISKNKDTLYFASDRPGGFGGFDIYYCLKLPEGIWGSPINIGEQINTPFDDNYPNLSKDGNKLFFASKGHKSIGGYDIFYSTFNEPGQVWTTPVNIGFPVNNAYDNKNITFTDNKRYAYISTIDQNTQGDFDIYKIIFLDVEPEFLIIKAQIFIDENGGKTPFNSNVEEISITIYKAGETYGVYSFDKRNNSFVLALAPGEYILEIESEKFKPLRKKLTIDENYYKSNQKELKVYLTRKGS